MTVTFFRNYPCDESVLTEYSLKFVIGHHPRLINRRVLLPEQQPARPCVRADRENIHSIDVHQNPLNLLDIR